MTGGGIKTRTRNLSDGWYMVFNTITSVLPAQPAAADLESFYNNVIDATASQLSTAMNTTENLAFKYGKINLRLSSATPSTGAGSSILRRICWITSAKILLLCSMGRLTVPIGIYRQ